MLLHEQGIPYEARAYGVDPALKALASVHFPSLEYIGDIGGFESQHVLYEMQQLIAGAWQGVQSLPLAWLVIAYLALQQLCRPPKMRLHCMLEDMGVMPSQARSQVT